MGLIDHHGSDPGPPGLPMSARFGPPPATVKPISLISKFGRMKYSKEPGAERMSGANKSVAYRIARWMKSASLKFLFAAKKSRVTE